MTLAGYVVILLIGFWLALKRLGGGWPGTIICAVGAWLLGGIGGVLLAVGSLTVLNILKLGEVGALIGAIFCVIGGGLLWGLGGALVSGGLAFGYWGGVLKGYPVYDRPLIVKTLAFRAITGPIAFLSFLAGVIILIIA